MSLYIQSGKVRLNVISSGGKEATIALLGTGDFFGEECIANSHPLRMVTATVIAEGLY
jgi:CRP/FNR family transcriptional regulator, cyclic AMP receptor protein